MLTPYVEVLRRRGALAFSAAGVVGRLPIAMESLGVVLLVSLTTDSYALAGVLASALALSASLISPLTSRWADRSGQLRVVPFLAISQSLALIAFVLAVRAGQPVWLLVLLAALGGALQPNIGSMVRARWSAMLTGTPQLNVAFALESVLDEMLFVIGPPLAAILATTVSPGAALLVSAVLVVVGGLSLAAQRRTQPPVHWQPEADHQPLGVTVLIIAVIFACLGITFGALDVATVAFANERGTAWLSGVLVSLAALGSLIGGLGFGARAAGRDLPRLLLWVSVASTVVALALPLLSSPILLAVALFLAGVTIAPSLICGYTIIENIVAPVRLTESITWATAGIGIGVAVASSVAGAVIDSASSSAGYWICVAGSALATLACAVTLPALERRWRNRSHTQIAN